MKKNGKKKERPGELWHLIDVDELLTAESDEDIVELPIEEIDPFTDHPFKVLDDEMMQDLAGSIKRNGILTPVMVRTKHNGRYEMISGHRRMRAAQIVELDTIPAIIRDMDDIDAVIVMVDANLKREKLLPSEMAYAFRMRYEAIKKKAGTPGVSGRILNGRTVTKAERMQASDPKRFCIRSDIEMAAAVGVSRGQLQRYLRLTELIPEFLEMVDRETLPLMTAVDISFIGEQAQQYLCDYIKENGMVKTYQVKDVEAPDLSRFHIINNKGVVTAVLDAEIVAYLIETTPMFILNRIPYLYEGGVYREDTFGIRIKSKIQGLLYQEFIRSSTLQRIYDLLLIQPSIQCESKDINNYPRHWINFRNGFFDVKEWVMVPHDRKYYSINQIPYDFNPDVEASKGMEVQRFLKDAIPNPEDQETYWQYLGYCMTTDTGFQKFMMIKGPGSTGKSVVVDITENTVGLQNSVSISLQDLNKRFYATSLFGKLLNACADIPSTALQSIDVLKKAVGEDSVLYERKGQDPTNFKSYAKLLFSANETPLNLDDKTNAYYRRLLILEMDHIIPLEQRDRKLKDKLKGETDYIIMMAMQALRKLYRQGSFTVSEHGRECVEELYRSADSVKAFLDERIIAKDGSRINRSYMFSEYEEYCKENDRQSHGKSVFLRMMKDKGYRIKRTQDGYFFMDVAFRDPGFVEVEPEEKVPFEQMKLDLRYKEGGENNGL